MIAKLEFKIPDEQRDFDDALKAKKYKEAIMDMKRALGNVYYDPHNDAQVNLVKGLREKFEDATKDLGIFDRG